MEQALNGVIKDLPPALKALADYVDECIVQIGRDFGGSHPLPEALRDYVGEIKGLKEGESLDHH